jgi:hypothetical protein
LNKKYASEFVISLVKVFLLETKLYTMNYSTNDMLSQIVDKMDNQELKDLIKSLIEQMKSLDESVMMLKNTIESKDS